MLDFIINQKIITKQDTLIISGTATTNNWDRGSMSSKERESLTVTPMAMRKAWVNYQKAGAKMLVDHGTTKNFGKKSIGKWLSYLYEPEDYQLDSPEILKMAIKVICEITDTDTIQNILDSKIDSFSMAWTTKNWLKNEKTGQRIDTEIVINELTVTGTPANKDATFRVVTDDKLLEQFNLTNNIEVFGSKAKVKEVLKNEKGNYFVDVEISNIKSINRISVQEVNVIPKIIIEDYKVSIRSERIKIDIK